MKEKNKVIFRTVEGFTKETSSRSRQMSTTVYRRDSVKREGTLPLFRTADFSFQQGDSKIITKEIAMTLWN